MLIRRFRTKDIAPVVGITQSAVRARLKLCGIEPCGKDGADHLYWPRDVYRAFPVLEPVPDDRDQRQVLQ